MKLFEISNMLLVAVRKQYIQQLILSLLSSSKQKLLIPYISIHTLKQTCVYHPQLLLFVAELLFSSNKHMRL